VTGQVEPFPPAAPAAARLPVRMLIGVVVSTTLGFLAGLVALLVGLPEAPRWVAVVVAGAGLVVAAVVSGYLIRRVIALDRERETLDREFARLSRAAALGEIASGIAHDLNNPLAVMNEEVGWLTDLLATANVVPEPTRQEFANSLKQIGQQIRRAADFTRRVLDWARDAERGNDTGCERAGRQDPVPP
jgi:signal transduction histidine kinase